MQLKKGKEIRFRVRNNIKISISVPVMYTAGQADSRLFAMVLMQQDNSLRLSHRFNYTAHVKCRDKKVAKCEKIENTHKCLPESPHQGCSVL